MFLQLARCSRSLGLWPGNAARTQRLPRGVRATAALIARAAESGYVRHETAFDVSLAAADLAWGVVERRAWRASLGFVGRPSLPGLRVTRARVSALAERPVRPAVLRELRSRSLVPRRPSAPVCSRCDVERIGEIARRPEGSLEERVERDCVFRRTHCRRAARRPPDSFPRERLAVLRCPRRSGAVQRAVRHSRPLEVLRTGSRGARPDPSLLGLPVSGSRGAALRGLGVLDPGELRACRRGTSSSTLRTEKSATRQPFSGTSTGSTPRR